MTGRTPSGTTTRCRRRLRRLLAAGLLPGRAGQPVKALVHVSLAGLMRMEGSSALTEEWAAQVRAQWAAARAAASVSGSDGGARPPGRGGPPQFPPPPSIRSAPHTPGSPSRLLSRLCTASMAFALISGARHSLSPPEDGTSNDAAGFASCYGPHRRSPIQGF
jgi:hypothetical protein